MSQYASLSVVMPYFKNERTLVRSLRSICAQKSNLSCNIVVVDDGGPVRAQSLVDKHTWPLPVKVIESHGRGQSEATNIGVRASTGELTILTCSDIIFTPRFVSHHLEAHARDSRPEGVIGNIIYAPWVRMTPLMHYLASPGPQFNFEVIKDHDCVSAGHVYAPNFSAPRISLLGHGPFDAELVYGFQDVDLGMRLKGAGMNLRYAAKAVALHDHPNGLEQFFERQRRVGKMLPYMMKKHPESGFAKRFEKLCHEARPLLANAEVLLKRVSELEKKVCATPGAFAALRQPLFETYDLVLMLGFILGVLQNADALRDVTAYSKQTVQGFLAVADEIGRDKSLSATLTSYLKESPSALGSSCA